jgi:hypothetical protein
MEVSCLFGRDCYHSGGILVACVRVSTGFSKGDCVLLAQASGYISIDPKWVKSNDGSSVSFIQSLGPTSRIRIVSFLHLEKCYLQLNLAKMAFS